VVLPRSSSLSMGFSVPEATGNAYRCGVRRHGLALNRLVSQSEPGTSGGRPSLSGRFLMIFSVVCSLSGLSRISPGFLGPVGSTNRPRAVVMAVPVDPVGDPDLDEVLREPPTRGRRACCQPSLRSFCFSHQNWIDPLFLISALPASPRTYFFGPEQEDMTRGFRNGLMRWGGVAVPYRPGGRGLVAARLASRNSWRTAIGLRSPGRAEIHAGEGVILPLLEGPAYMSLRSGVLLVPVAINGTSWLAFRRRVRVRIGPPIASAGGDPSRPTSEAVRTMTAEV